MGIIQSTVVQSQKLVKAYFFWRLAGGWFVGWLAADWLKAVSQFFFNPLQDIFIMRF